jgi:2-C-methyl-D-erythritol 4-phosphate cytidylyltransferase
MGERGSPGTFRAAESAQATWAIVVAAGSGERLGSDRPKAFAALGGRPLLAESVERLDASDWVDAIVVAAPAGWEEPAILLAEELVASKVSSVVTGGATRAKSVRNALAEVPEEALVVLVHDAARPLVDDGVIERLLGRLDGTVDGVVPALAVQDTVKRVRGGLVSETVDRAELAVVQTPQAFVADRLRAAYGADLSGATDCASLVERGGGTVAVIEGDPRLAKVTTAQDLARVSRLLEAEGR